MENKPQTITSPGGIEIAYSKLEGRGPTIVFLGGFMSDMTGSKAAALHEYCAANKFSFLRFDYSGHGQSGGRFEDLSIDSWFKDALYVIEKLTEGELILIGSSMGGWISLLVAMKLQERTKALIGIAAAPDFTHEMYHKRLSDVQKKQLEETGITEMAAEFGRPYLISRKLIDGSAKHLIMSYEEWPITIPVRLIHGMNDAQVPWTTSLRVSEKLTGPDVRVILEKNGDHRMSEPANLKLIITELEKLLNDLP